MQAASSARMLSAEQAGDSAEKRASKLQDRLETAERDITKLRADCVRAVMWACDVLSVDCGGR